jgi:hypothetical protein
MASVPLQHGLSMRLFRTKVRWGCEIDGNLALPCACTDLCLVTCRSQGMCALQCCGSYHGCQPSSNRTRLRCGTDLAVPALGGACRHVSVYAADSALQRCSFG